jgi:predicted ATP-dependent serine protease
MSVKDIQAKYAKGVVFDASLLLDTPSKIIPTTPNLDIGLFGGIPEGSLAILSGPPKCGKSTLCLQIIKNAYDLYKKRAFYIDVEHRLKALNLRGIAGLDTSPEALQIIRSSGDKILEAESLLDIATELIKSEPGSLIILDSSSALCSMKEMVDEITGQTRSLGPKLLSAFCS